MPAVPSPADYWKHHLALPPRIRIRVTVTVDVRVWLGFGVRIGVRVRIGAVKVGIPGMITF